MKRFDAKELEDLEFMMNRSREEFLELLIEDNNKMIKSCKRDILMFAILLLPMALICASLTNTMPNIVVCIILISFYITNLNNMVNLKRKIKLKTSTLEMELVFEKNKGK